MKKAVRLALNILTWLFAFLSILVSTISFIAQADEDGIPTVNGYCMICITNSSMNGDSIQEDDLIIGKRTTGGLQNNLQKGNIVSFWTDNNNDGLADIDTGRIVEVLKDADGIAIKYIAQGDSSVPSMPNRHFVYPNDVICTYSGTRIAGLGAVLSFLLSQIGFFVAVILPLAALFLYQLIYWILILQAFRAEHRERLAEETVKQSAVEKYKQKKTWHRMKTRNRNQIFGKAVVRQ